MLIESRVSWSSFLAAALLIVAPALTAQERQVPEIETEFVFEIRAEIADAIEMGESVDGQRRSIPITGGSFEGEDIRGEVLPGGADYQVVRADGLVALRAVYMIRTDDGALINVVNEGLINRDPEESYFRTSPEFVAPIGPHDWLNKHIFVGTAHTREDMPGNVFIRIYKVL